MSENSIAAAHTPGPWRWEFNRKHKNVALVGGRPMYDLTVMDFTRWGMGGAVPRVRDLAHDGMNILHRVCDRPDWIAPFPSRDHHADWCAALTHADMVLIAAAPDLLEALQVMSAHYSGSLDYQPAYVKMGRAAIAKVKATP